MKFPSSLALALSIAAPAVALDYKNDVLPIMKEHCWKCHSNEHEVKGNLAFDDLEEVRKYQIGKYNLIRPGNPKESNFVERLLLDPGHTDFMPRKAGPLAKSEIGTIEQWIEAGAVVDSSAPSEEEKAWLGGPGDMADSPAGFVTWTNSEGKTIEASFAGLSQGSVSLLMKDGKRYEVPLDSLSPESAAQAEKLAK